MVMATGSPSGSVTPAMDTSTNWWFGGQSIGGLAAAALQSGGRFVVGTVVVVVGGSVVVVGGGTVVVVGGTVVVVGGSVVVVVGGTVVVVVGGIVVVVGGTVVVVGGRVVVVVVVVDAGSVAVDVVVVAMVVLVVDVVVDPAPITDTLQPVPVAGRIGAELVSKRVFTVRPMAVVALAVAATPKVIMATLTTPVGDVRLALWKAERLVVPGVGVFVVGLPENSAVLPPPIDASVRTAGSYVTAIE